MIWQQMKTQLKDEFDENTRLLTMYNLIGLSEHDNDNDHHHYKKKIVCKHSTTIVVRHLQNKYMTN